MPGPLYYDPDIAYDNNGDFEDNSIGQRNKRICPDPSPALTFHYCIDSSDSGT